MAAKKLYDYVPRRNALSPNVKLAAQSRGRVDDAIAFLGRCNDCRAQIWFLKCLRKKTNRQIVLNGGLHLSDYVTKVMKRLSDQSVDPKVVLEFGGILPAASGS